MTNQKATTDWDLERDFQQRIRPLLERASWVLRVTEYKDKPVPVFVVKERSSPEEDQQKNGKAVGKTVLRDRGLLYGQSLRRCLPVIRTITGSVCDDAGIPLDLQRFLGNGRIAFRGNLPMDEEAGVKLSLIFKLQERVKEMDRVELIAWRVARFSREEAAYWLTRVTQYGEAANRWALAGMRIMLGGQPGDPAILHMLEKLRR
ncbi:hypothetical protein SY88_02265 [Clostridiales bacterium PH28_bin88]|nr:hypothetical protein SY88_02265 [Clostridiales bacterium PH28_bin88]